MLLIFLSSGSTPLAVSLWPRYTDSVVLNYTYWGSLPYQFFELSPSIWLNVDHGLHLSDPKLKYKFLFQFVEFHQNSGWYFCGQLLVSNTFHMTILWIYITQMVYSQWLILCCFHQMVSANSPWFACILAKTLALLNLLAISSNVGSW